jgi:polysaccharide biosynthesis protein PslJ
VTVAVETAPTRAPATTPVVPSPLRLPAVGFVVAYCVLLLCIPSRLVVGPIGGGGTPAGLAGVGALVWWLFATLSGQNPVRGFTPLRVGVAAFTGAVLAAYANGNAAGWYAPPSVRGVTDDVYDLVPPRVDQVAQAMVSTADRGLLVCAGWVGITLLAAEGLRSWRDLHLLTSWLVWLGAVVAGVGILQFFTGLDISRYFTVIPGLSPRSDFGVVASRSIFNRPSSTAIHPIEFGVVLAALLPLALHRALLRWGGKLVVPPAATIAVATFMSVSRSAVLATIVALAVLMLGWSWRWRRRALLLAPVFVIALRQAIPGLVGTIISLFRNLGNDPSVSGRTGDYDVVLWLYHDHEIFGRGLFTFVPRYYRILDNQYLMLLLELGLVGLAAALLLFGTGFFSARTTFRRAATFESRHLGLALSGSILGLFVIYGTFDALSFPMAAGLTFLLLGMAGAARRFALEDRAESLS